MLLTIGLIVGVWMPVLLLVIQALVLLQTGAWHWYPLAMVLMLLGVDGSELDRLLGGWPSIVNIVVWILKVWIGVPFLAAGFFLICAGVWRGDLGRGRGSTAAFKNSDRGPEI